MKNQTIHNTFIKDLGKLNITDPSFGDVKLNLFPFENDGNIKLPYGYKLWEKTLNEIMSHVPKVKGANSHFVTIDSKFFTVAEFLRREGVHADGNFCADPKFSLRSWGGTQTTWGGTSIEEEEEEQEVGERTTWGGTRTTWGGARLHPNGNHYTVITPWVSPYNVEIPFGDYITDEKGGILCVSSYVGCQGWQGEFYGEIGNEGCFDNMLNQLTDDRKVVFEANKLYFMTSNTPHESLLIPQGVRRTFMRVTLHHEYPNQMLKCMQDLLQAK